MADNPAPNNSDPVTDMVEAARRDTEDQVANARRGALSVYTCPECGGSLWQVDTPVLLQFRCHVGHVLSGDDLLLEQAQAIESSLWRALRLLDDHRTLARQMAPEAREHGLSEQADWLDGLISRAEQKAHDLHRMIESGEFPSKTNAGLEA